MTVSFTVVDSPATAPTLLTQEGSDHAVAFNATTFVREPFSVFTTQNFSTDKRTRLVLFASDLDIALGSSTADVQLYAENALIGSVPLTIEHIGKVPFFNWLTQIQIILPDNVANTGDIWLRVTWRGVSSNQVRISMKQATAAVRAPSGMSLFADSTLAVANLRLWQPLAMRRPPGS